jgi:putative ABC transport system permease protein
VYVDGVEDYLDAVAGDPYEEGASGEVLEVWMHTKLAEKMGVAVGDEFNAGVTMITQPIPIRIKGFWQASEPTDPFWFNNPDTTLADSLLVRRQDYITRVQPLISSKTGSIHWHIILDEGQVTPEDARKYLSGFELGLVEINRFLPDAKLTGAPTVPLEDFVQRETTLTTLLLSFNVPAFIFVLYFLILTSMTIARSQHRDAAILVSRGTGISGILRITLAEELLLFIVGFPLGIGFGMLLARAMGYTASFLSFIERAPLPVTLRGVNWQVAFVALGVALIARLIPAAQAARQSVVEMEREQARPIRGPFWHRFYLDFLLLVPTVYAYNQLSISGTLAMLVDDRPEDLYRDPLLILVPALFILTASLMTLRIFPLIMRAIDKLLSLIPWVTPHMVFRRLSRQSMNYISPLLLIVVSLGLGVYSFSMANSLDQWLIDRMYYRVGTDLTFEPFPLGSRASTSPEQPIDGTWIPLPDEFRSVTGVTAASRVGDFGFSSGSGGQNRVRGRFLAIDRFDFPSVSWFRHDFADEPLGALMNRLALLPDGILVSERVLREQMANVGDKIDLLVAANNELVARSQFTIVGSYKYFPTVFEEDELTVVGNLDFVSNIMGTSPPHDIWMRIRNDAEGQAVMETVPRIGVEHLGFNDAAALIEEEQAKTERVGIFGTLSVGFLAAVAMAAIGLMTYSYASLTERLYRFAVLRALGLRRRQIVSQVILEYALLTVFGAAAGALIGLTASELFVPFFRVTGEMGTPLPPLLPVFSEQGIQRLAFAFAVFMVVLEIAVIANALSWRSFAVLRGRGE